MEITENCEEFAASQKTNFLYFRLEVFQKCLFPAETESGEKRAFVNEKTLDRKHYVPDDAGDKSLPWQQGWFKKRARMEACRHAPPIKGHL